ncbi:MAG: hypothetical protein AAF628_04410 [Planctomycetota bacterium]
MSTFDVEPGNRWPGASFEEKSVWIQLASLVLALGGYFYVAGSMLGAGERALSPFAPLFVTAVVLMVVINIVGHVASAIASRPELRDERDRLIGWRAESASSWLLAIGIFAAISAMLCDFDNVWTAHVLLLALFFAELLRCVLQLLFYRRGV